jgi:hypothetical protein
MTTLDIIKILPLDETERIQLLNKYEHGTKEQKTQISMLAWSGYFDLYDQRLKENIRNEFRLIKKGEGGSLDEKLYVRALKNTEQELNKETSQQISETDLTRAREAMKQIITEIRASKKSKKRTVNV